MKEYAARQPVQRCGVDGCEFQTKLKKERIGDEVRWKRGGGSGAQPNLTRRASTRTTPPTRAPPPPPRPAPAAPGPPSTTLAGQRVCKPISCLLYLIRLMTVILSLSGTSVAFALGSRFTHSLNPCRSSGLLVPRS
jgi:hypothetical protein